MLCAQPEPNPRKQRELAGEYSRGGGLQPGRAAQRQHKQHDRGCHRGRGSSSPVVTPQTPPGALRESCTPPGGDPRGTVKDTSLWGLPPPPPRPMSLHPTDLPAQPVPLNLLCPLPPGTTHSSDPKHHGELQHTPTPLRWGRAPMGALTAAHELPTGWDTAPLLFPVLPTRTTLSVVILSLFIPNPPVPCHAHLLPAAPISCHTHLSSTTPTCFLPHPSPATPTCPLPHPPVSLTLPTPQLAQTSPPSPTSPLPTTPCCSLAFSLTSSPPSHPHQAERVPAELHATHSGDMDHGAPGAPGAGPRGGARGGHVPFSGCSISPMLPSGVVRS